MKQKLTILLVAILLISGCAVTPEQQLYNHKLAFLGTLKTINVLKEANRFDADELKEIRAFANAGNEILLQWEVVGGTTPEPLGAFEVILRELIAYRLRGTTNE